jgi:hypothetical protein
MHETKYTKIYMSTYQNINRHINVWATYQPVDPANPLSVRVKVVMPTGKRLYVCDQ